MWSETVSALRGLVRSLGKVISVHFMLDACIYNNPLYNINGSFNDELSEGPFVR